MKLKSILLTALAILGLTAATMAQVPNYVPTNGLVGWWPFNGNANDESGNGNNGTVNGATLTLDRFGIVNGAYSFNGTSNFIEVTDNNTLDFTNQYSISIWVQINDYSLNSNSNALQRSMLGKPRNTGGGGYSFRALEGVDWNSDGNPIPYIGAWNTPTANGGVESLTDTLHLNIWTNLIFTYDGTTAKLFKNSQLINSQAVSYSLVNSTESLFFGKEFTSINNDARWFKGQLDDIGFWNRALTQQEITALYTATSSNNNETANTAANVPGAISYQAVARDPQGAPLADTNVQVRFTLIADSLSGSEEYVETHTLSTNSLGLFTTAFGAGTPISNTFGNINWSAGNKYLNVQIDTGNGLVDMGTQQLLSTPYSLYSAKAGEIKNPGLPVFSGNAAALAGGLIAGDMYRTSTGVLMVVY